MDEITEVRSGLLGRDELARLTRPNTPRVLFDIAFHWALIVASWVLVAFYPSIPAVILAIIVVGTQANALLVIAHDGIHRNLCRSKAANNWIVDALILGAVGLVDRINRVNHSQHHAKLCSDGDPVRPNYAHDFRPNRLGFLLFFTGLLTFLRQIRNIFSLDASAPQGPRERYRPRDLAIIGTWQIVLLGSLSAAIGWWAYPVLWMLPFFVFYFLTNMARQFAEHSDLVPDPEAERRRRLITFMSNPIERIIFSPHNRNYHAVHHRWPTIP